MYNRQRITLDSFQRMQDFNDTFKTDLATIEDFPDEKKTLDESVITIQDAYVVQSTPLGSDDPAIEAKKKAMSTLINSFTMRCVVKAKKIGDLKLAAALNKPITFIQAADKSKSIANARGLVKLMSDNLSVLTSIKSTDIDSMNKSIDAYEGIQNDSIEAVQERKTGGTQRMPDAFVNGREACEHIVMLVHSYFDSTNSEMVDAADAALELHETGIRHTKLDLDILDDETGQPIAGAILTDTLTTKHFTSDLLGAIEIASHTSGFDTFTIEAGGYIPFTFGITFVRGTESHFVARLKKKG